MKVIEIICREPVNKFMDSIQKHCMLLMSQPEQHGILTLKDLENKTLDFANKEILNYPRCSLDKLEVYYDSTVVSEWYNLIYGESSIMTVFARPDFYAPCFKDYDDARLRAKAIA